MNTAADEYDGRLNTNVGGRSPIASPLPSPNRTTANNGYGVVGGAASGSNSSSQHSSFAVRSTASAARSGGGGGGIASSGPDGSMGGHEYGPYAPLSRRTNNASASYETESSAHSSKDKLMANSVMGGALYTDAEDYRKAEADDYLHDPRGADKHSHAVSLRGCLNIFTLVVLVLGLLTLFAGYPIIYHFVTDKEGNKGAYGLGGTNGTGQVASLTAVRPLVDPDTPQSARTFTSPVSNTQYDLQFSDEFEQEGRTFWPGDDQFFEAVDIWYGVTADYEWYSPENVNTTGGALTLTMTDIPSHNLNFQSGMVQSWNKLCFTGGYIEFSIIQPGSHTTQGYWPGAWVMGNLGRPGYAATTDGMWPYSYQACDTGILPNQTNAQGGPNGAVASDSDNAANGQLSKLPGMRTPSCTCSGEDHPGPKNSIGRSAPEIDVLEAQIQSKGGVKNAYASQSMQVAPYDADYQWIQSAATVIGDNTEFNTYSGGPYQESVSSVSMIPQRGFADVSGPDSAKWVTFGMEWQPDYEFNGGGFVTWYVDGKPTWTATSATVPASTAMQISRRIVPVEPMAIVMNLGMSKGFQTVDLDPDTGLAFPAQMKFDYVRVYQQKGKEQMSCDPPDYPTADYINRHIDVYNNPNLTTWNETQYSWPKNKLRSGC